jgi:hypothetical protein
MLTRQSVQNYQPPVELSPTTYLYIPGNPTHLFQAQIHTVSLVTTSNWIEQPIHPEQFLMIMGKLLATKLASILEQLRDYNLEYIHPITSIIEPFIEPERDLYAHMPPKKSREITLTVTRGGKAKPKASLD